MPKGWARKHTERIDAERWSWILPRMEEGERPLERGEAWLVLPRGRMMAVVMLTHTTLYVCVVEDVGTIHQPLIYQLRLRDADELLMADNGMVVIQGISGSGERGSTVLDFIPNPLSWRFMVLLRDTYQTQSGNEPRGNWSAPPFDLKAQLRWTTNRDGYAGG